MPAVISANDDHLRVALDFKEYGLISANPDLEDHGSEWENNQRDALSREFVFEFDDVEDMKWFLNHPDCANLHLYASSFNCNYV